MDLWIRSQDKEELVKINKAISIEEIEDTTKYLKDFGDNHYFIQSEDWILGAYKSKERALEVLDEIHDAIAKNEAFVLYSNIGNVSVMSKEVFRPVYKMPQ